MQQALRRTGIRMPILMITSLPKVAGMSFDEDAEIVPVDELAEKPVSPRRLSELVNELIRAKR
jgi:hypothetical protein